MKLLWSTFCNWLKIQNETCLQKRNLVLLEFTWTPTKQKVSNPDLWQSTALPVQTNLWTHRETHADRDSFGSSRPPLAHLSRPGKSSRSCGRHSVGEHKRKANLFWISAPVPQRQKAGSCFPVSQTTRPGMCCFFPHLMFNRSISGSAGYETPSSSIRSADTKQMWLTSGLWIYLWKGILICWRLDFKNVTGV